MTTHAHTQQPAGLAVTQTAPGRATGTQAFASARLAGVLYAVIIAFGIFAEVVVRSRLIVPGDPGATADNVLGSEWLFRLGFAADMVVFLADVGLAVILYMLFRPVSQVLSLLAAAFRLTQTAIIGLNLLSMFAALRLLRDAEYMGEFGAGQSQALALQYLDTHKYGYILGLTFFGVSTIIIGVLALRSGRMPRLLGVLLAVAGAGYITDSALFFLAPGYDGGASAVVLAPALVAEVWLCLWLLLKGRKLDALSHEKRDVDARPVGAST